MKRQATPQQREAAQARRAQMRAIAKNISQLNDEQRAELAARCPVVTIEGRALSPFNQCMIAQQRPDATVVGGFRQWITAGRVVRKGEHGACIWIPAGSSKACPAETPDAGEIQSDGEGSTCRFLLGTVFDIAQTDEKGPE